MKAPNLTDWQKENLMMFPWIIFYSLLGAGVLLTLALVTGNLFPWSLLGISSLILSYMQYKIGVKEIKARPPQMGVITYWGERQVIAGGKIAAVKEGRYLTMSYWPFNIDLLPIDIGKINKDDVPIRDIICRSTPADPSKPGVSEAGGRISAFFSYTFAPDPSRLKEYIDYKEEKGVTEILENQISETIRQKGRLMTWEEFQFSGDKLTAEMVVRLSGDKPVKLKRDPGNQNIVWINPATGKPEEAAPVERLETDKCLDEEIAYFLEQKVRGSSCYADVQDLGIIIHRANIEKFELGDDLKKAAENLAREEQERRSEVMEVKTEIMQAEELLKAFKKADPATTKDLDFCILEIRRRKAQREGKNVSTFEIPGLEKAAEAVATIFKGMKGGNP